MKNIFLGIATVLVFDLAGFTLWKVSGQVPFDTFYIGTITSHILNLF